MNARSSHFPNLVPTSGSSDVPEAESFVQADGTVVLCLDGRHHDVLAEFARAFDQHRHERFGDAFAALVRADIHGVLHGVPVAVERAPVAERA